MTSTLAAGDLLDAPVGLQSPRARRSDRRRANHRRSDRLLSAIEGKPALIITHDNPDPDAIAAGWALRELFRTRGVTARVVGRGGVVRAENRHMIRLLRPPLEFVEELPADGHAMVLVDCVPSGGNHPVEGGSGSAAAVIDHHEPSGHRFRVRFRDIRPSAVATASIVAGYLREQGVVPDADLATALLFAIRTEMSGHEVRLTRGDRGILIWLSGLADHARLASIMNAPLTRLYFADLLLAVQNIFAYDHAAVCFLPQASGAEIVGEVADMVIRCEDIDQVLCAAVVGDDAILSARTTEAGGDAVALLGAALRGMGHWGGHRHRAGGRISNVAQTVGGIDAINAELKERWLKACGVDCQRGVRLVPRKAILEQM